MAETKQRLKVYCETTFWSYLNGGRTPLSHIALKQAATLQWWEGFAPTCDIYVSQYVNTESRDGDPYRAELRRKSLEGIAAIDGSSDEVTDLAEALMSGHAVPDSEPTDAFHIATAAVNGMDVLLTWNCKHMANPITLPATASIIAKAGYRCPVILTPEEFMTRKEELGYGE